MLTQERLKELFNYNPDTGLFIRLTTVSANAVKGSSPRRLNSDGYMEIMIDRAVYRTHRLAWFYVHNEWPIQIDHIKGNRLDNRIAKLRSVTNQENMKNRRLFKNNTSGVMGVCWCKKAKKWQVRISVCGKKTHIGCFAYKWDAICARKSAERTYKYHENHGRAK